MQKTGIFTWFGYVLPMEERLALIREACFESVMLWWSGDFSETDGPYRQVPALARRMGLAVENAHLPYQGVNELWMDSADADDLEARLLGDITDAAACCVPTLVLHLTSGWEPPPPNERGIARLRRAAEHAERLGVRLALENLKRPEYLDYAFARLDSPAVGFCYDSGHDYVVSKSNALLSKFGHRLMALHLHDNDGTGDLHHLPGEGRIDWPALREALRQTPYTGAVTLESAEDRFECGDRIDVREYLRLSRLRAGEIAWF